MALLPALVNGDYMELTNITAAVFGTTQANRSFIPAAFGDFNSDKLTDMVVLKDSEKTVAVLLATEQKVVSSGDDPPLFVARPDSSLECNAPEGKIVSAVPADFDGDGGLDLMIVTKKIMNIEGQSKKVMAVWVIWGDSSPGAALDCDKKVKVAPIKNGTVQQFDSEPVVIDFNRDYIADLLFVTTEGDREVLLFSTSRTVGSQEQMPIDSQNHNDQLKAEHSSAWIDLSGDGAADLMLTTQAGLELYKGEKGGLQMHSLVPWPTLLEGCSVDQCVGQAVFADFNLEGELDLVLPVCFDPSCSNSSLLQHTVKEVWEKGAKLEWKVMSLDLGGLRFLPADQTSDSPLRLLSPRVGDVDLDGFPDLLVTLYNHDKLGEGASLSSVAEPMLLLNTGCGSFSGCHPTWRQFQLSPKFMQGTGNGVMAAFFDLYEDGKLDVVVVDAESKSVTAWSNTTQNSDAYFIKVIVLSGACYHDCPAHEHSYVPYGTNSGGQMVGYRQQRAGPEEFDSYCSVAPQIPQTAHFALQLPYTIFGLGVAPNFVDYMWVNVSTQSHAWPQVIPNSQLYVIPYPRDKPDQWDAKLIIFTSKNIVITGLSMVGVCAFVSCIIVMLHLRERRLDHQAKLQEAHRFHFDAM